MNNREIGNALRVRRRFLHLRQEDLAEMSGVTVKTIHLVESGNGNPSVKTLEKLAQILGMNLLIQVKKVD